MIKNEPNSIRKSFFALLFLGTWLLNPALLVWGSVHFEPNKHFEQKQDTAWDWANLLAEIFGNDGQNEPSSEDHDNNDIGPEDESFPDGAFAFLPGSTSSSSLLSVQHISNKVNCSVCYSVAQAFQPRYDLFCCWKSHLG